MRSSARVGAAISWYSNLAKSPVRSSLKIVITSYSIHYTKLYEAAGIGPEPDVLEPADLPGGRAPAVDELLRGDGPLVGLEQLVGDARDVAARGAAKPGTRITSYNVCYTKLLRQQ